MWMLGQLCLADAVEQRRSIFRNLSAVKEKKAREIPERKSIRALTTERNITPISLDGRFRIVGERINPTGKKELQEKLRAGDLSLVMDMAEEQEKLGASILDVNMGMNGN